MKNSEPIVIIEDDQEDQEVMALILKQLKVDREVKFFDQGQKAYDYLLGKEIIPFLIFSDINMPGMNGFQLRDKLHESDGLRAKCIPFLFLTTGGDSKFIWEGYAQNAQGYFIKPNSIEGWKKLFSLAIEYWEYSKKPR